MKQTQQHGDVMTRRLPESLRADGSEETQSRFLLLAQNKIRMKGCRRTKYIQSFCPRPPSSLDLGGKSFQSVFESREQSFLKKRRKLREFQIFVFTKEEKNVSILAVRTTIPLIQQFQLLHCSFWQEDSSHTPDAHTRIHRVIYICQALSTLFCKHGLFSAVCLFRPNANMFLNQLWDFF